jgi:hypothetical protein
VKCHSTYWTILIAKKNRNCKIYCFSNSSEFTKLYPVLNSSFIESAVLLNEFLNFHHNLPNKIFKTIVSNYHFNISHSICSSPNIFFLIDSPFGRKSSAKSIKLPGCKVCLNSCGLSLYSPVFNLVKNCKIRKSFGHFL